MPGKRRRESNPESLAAEAYATEADEINFEEIATLESVAFQDHLILLYGPPKIGKTKFCSLIDGVYFLPTEPGYRANKCRKTRIGNWATFKQFIKTMEKKPKLCRTVKTWCIDTADNLAKFCMQYVCGREGISHPADQQWGKGWEAFRDEFTHWLLRLGVLGPGIIIVSHETEREIVSHSLRMTKISPALPKTCYTVVNNLADIILRMGFAVKRVKTKRGKVREIEDHEMRCLYTRPSDLMDAGDRTGKLPEVIFFKTEQEAVDKIYEIFAAERRPKSKSKSKNRSKNKS